MSNEKKDEAPPKAQRSPDEQFHEREMDVGKSVSNYRAALATTTPPVNPAPKPADKK